MLRCVHRASGVAVVAIVGAINFVIVVVAAIFLAVVVAVVIITHSSIVVPKAVGVTICIVSVSVVTVRALVALLFAAFWSCVSRSA